MQTNTVVNKDVSNLTGNSHNNNQLQLLNYFCNSVMSSLSSYDVSFKIWSSLQICINTCLILVN